MANEEVLRVVVFRDGDQWVAQCVEYDIGAQADDVDKLELLFSAVVEAEVQESVNRHGQPFAGIPRAPDQFEAMWGKRSKAFEMTPKPFTQSSFSYDMALVA